MPRPPAEEQLRCRCSGEQVVLAIWLSMKDESVATVRGASVTQTVAAAAEQLRLGEPSVLATVLKRRGSTPSSPGQKLLLLSDQQAIGTVGGGAVEWQALEQMATMWRNGSHEPVVVEYQLGAALGMCCGGSVTMLLEPLHPARSVLLVGAGHIGSVLAPLLVGLDLRVLWCDAREGVHPNMRRIAALHGEQLVALEAEHDDPEILAGLRNPARTAALVMTHDHQLDQRVIEWALQQNFDFIGGVGSRAKAARTRKRLAHRSFSEVDQNRFEMPLGADIPARSPAEVAIAIATSVIRWRSQSQQARVSLPEGSSPTQ